MASHISDPSSETSDISCNRKVFNGNLLSHTWSFFLPFLSHNWGLATLGRPSSCFILHHPYHHFIMYSPKLYQSVFSIILPLDQMALTMRTGSCICLSADSLSDGSWSVHMQQSTSTGDLLLEVSRLLANVFASILLDRMALYILLGKIIIW